jgi:hypothetical protein
VNVVAAAVLGQAAVKGVFAMARVAIACVITLALLIGLGAGVGSPVGHAQPPDAAVQAPRQPDIEAAIRGGVGWLRTQQVSAGNWSYKGGGSYDLGLTALVGLALLEAGLPPDDPAVGAALRYVRSELARNAQYALLTYNASTALLFLERAGDAQDAPLVRALAGSISSGQVADGGWGYYVTAGYGADQEKLRGGNDNSNTQFAVIALLAGRKTINGADDALGRAAQRFIHTQDATGGWRYKGDFGASVSMTCAGLIGLGAGNAVDRVPPSIVAYSPGDRPGEAQRGPGRPAEAKGAANAPAVQSPVARAMSYLERALPAKHAYCRQLIASNGQLPRTPPRTVKGISIDYTTGQAKSAITSSGGGGYLPPEWWLDYYELWSVERVAVAFNLKRIGDFDWYASGSSLLVTLQQRDGSWQDGHYGPVTATAFALLFLRKANLAPEISTKIAEGSGEPATTEARQPDAHACVWVRQSPNRGRVWKLSFAVATAEDLLAVVEKLGGSLVVREGTGARKLDKPASEPKNGQRVAWKNFERRSDVWRHDAASLPNLDTLLGVRQADELLVVLPASVTRQIQSLINSRKLEQRAGSSGEVTLGFGTRDEPIDPNSLDPTNLRLDPILR